MYSRERESCVHPRTGFTVISRPTYLTSAEKRFSIIGPCFDVDISKFSSAFHLRCAPTICPYVRCPILYLAHMLSLLPIDSICPYTSAITVLAETSALALTSTQFRSAYLTLHLAPRNNKI